MKARSSEKLRRCARTLRKAWLEASRKERGFCLARDKLLRNCPKATLRMARRAGLVATSSRSKLRLQHSLRTLDVRIGLRELEAGPRICWSRHEKGAWHAFANDDQRALHDGLLRCLRKKSRKQRLCRAELQVRLPAGGRVDLSSMRYYKGRHDWLVLWNAAPRGCSLQAWLCANVLLRANVRRVRLVRTPVLLSAVRVPRRGPLVFHGTSSANARSIARLGFDKARRNHQVYGAGEYHSDLFHVARQHGGAVVVSQVGGARLHGLHRRIHLCPDPSRQLPLALVD